MFLKPDQERLSIAALTSGLEEGMVGGLRTSWEQLLSRPFLHVC